MKKIITFTLSVFIISSCQKDKIEIQDSNNSNNQSISYIFPCKSGSYWVYEWFSVDSLGVELSTGTIDSLFITGDTVIGNNTFIKYAGTFLGSPKLDLMRDSSGYIINSLGSIEYSYIDFENSFNNWSDVIYNSYDKMVDMSNSEISVPAGVFNTIEKQQYLSRSDQEEISHCAGNEVIYNSNFESGIGKIRLQTAYAANIPNCIYLEQRLIDYYIP